MTEPLLLIERDDGVLSIVLNRPERKNALTRELKPTFERDGKAIFVMKVLGPLG